MKFYHLVLALCCLCLTATFLPAQIHIDSEEDVGIGTTDTNTAKLRLRSPDNHYGLHITQNSSAAHGPGNCAIFSEVFADGLNMRSGIFNRVYHNPAATSNATGISNWVYPGGSGFTYGMQNWLTNSGTGTKIGYQGYFFQNAASNNALYGMSHHNRNYGSGMTYGYYQNTFADGTGEKYGIWSSVAHPISATTNATGVYSYTRNIGTGATIAYRAQIPSDGLRDKYGFWAVVNENTNSLKSTYGIFAETHLNGARPGYGFYNHVRDAGTSSNKKYGIYNWVEDHVGNTDERFGIYTYLENKGTGNSYALFSRVEGGNDYAGFFDGNVVVTGSMTYGTSDVRLKENLTPLNNSLAVIKKLRPMAYRFKQDQGINLPIGKQFGLIAQEVEEVLPHLVSEYTQPGKPIYKKRMVKREETLAPDTPKAIQNRDDLEDSALAEQTLPITKIVEEEINELVGYEQAETYKAINYQGLIPVLVGALQEQAALMEAMDAKIKILERQLAKIDAKR